MVERIAVLGLGYVGLPLAQALAEAGLDVTGFDIDTTRIADLRRSGKLSASLTLSADPETLRERTFYIVAVPTPIDDKKQPDLAPLRSASSLVGESLTQGDMVVYESTVYPGVTEDICVPILEDTSGLSEGEGFHVGYSPERINPGDTKHTLDSVMKIVSATDPEGLDRMCAVYETVVSAGLHRAPSIQVAEAAKVVENTQRDLNIALMNELAILFDRLSIPTRDVLRAARTKWNFLSFDPGLVGGHCLGVDPYYLTARAKEVGYHPEIILAGRRINDRMGVLVAQRLVKMLIQSGRTVRNARIGILGIAYKPDVPDCRNSRVPEMIQELRGFGVEPLVHDPWVSADWVMTEYNVPLVPYEHLDKLDGIVLAVPHRAFLDAGMKNLEARIAPKGVLVDVTGALEHAERREDLSYWCL